MWRNGMILYGKLQTVPLVRAYCAVIDRVWSHVDPRLTFFPLEPLVKVVACFCNGD